MDLSGGAVPVASSGDATALATTTTSVNVSNAAAPDELEQILEITSLSPLEMSYVKPSPRRFNVKRHGVMGDGVDVYGANINNGTAALYVTGAAFTNADVGKGIGVEGAGASGGWLITTIQSYTDATNVTLAANASTTVSSVFATKLYAACYGTDDTTALQTLINTRHAECVAGTGGNVELFFPDGLYLLNGALKNGVTPGGYSASIDFNAQVYVPGLPPDTNAPLPGQRTNGNLNQNRWQVTFRGETHPHWLQSHSLADDYPPRSGARLRSMIQGSGTLPAILTTKGGGAATPAANGVNNFQFGADLHVEDIAFEYTVSSGNKATICGVNGDRAKVANYHYVSVAPHNYQAHTNLVQPTDDLAGLISSGSAAEPNGNINYCNALGYKWGIIIGEHVAAYRCSVQACLYAYGVMSTPFLVMIRDCEFHACTYAIAPAVSLFPTRLGITPELAMIEGTIYGESETASAGFTPTWMRLAAFVYDPSNYLYGSLSIQLATGSTGYGTGQESKVGGENLRTNVIGKFAPYITHTGTSYTFQSLYEAQQVHGFSAATDITVTMPKGDTATLAGYCYNFDINTEIETIQIGAGNIIPVGASGCTVTLPAGMTQSNGVGAKLRWRKVSTNQWYVNGDLMA